MYNIFFVPVGSATADLQGGTIPFMNNSIYVFYW